MHRNSGQLAEPIRGDSMSRRLICGSRAKVLDRQAYAPMPVRRPASPCRCRPGGFRPVDRGLVSAGQQLVPPRRPAR
jgi:hypothetical protein